MAVAPKMWERATMHMASLTSILAHCYCTQQITAALCLKALLLLRNAVRAMRPRAGRKEYHQNWSASGKYELRRNVSDTAEICEHFR